MKEANRLLADFISELAKQRRPEAGKDTTVADLLEQWHAQGVALGWAPRTAHEALRTIDKVLVPELGAVPLRDLEARHLDQLYRRLLTGEGRDRKVSAATVRRQRRQGPRQSRGCHG